MYMQEKFGAFQVGNDETKGAIEFKIFFPDRAVSPDQYHAQPQDVPDHTPPVEGYGDPQIEFIKVVGDFQAHLGQAPWDGAAAPAMVRENHPKGFLFRYKTPIELPSDFYQYKYLVGFKGGKHRLVGDPCARYGGAEYQNSGVVIGGSNPAVKPVQGGRKPLRDLVIYELMIDDFTDEFRGWRAPIDAVQDKLDYLRQVLGVNAILFMPWTAWPGDDFSWGYTPHQYFSVEYRYANALRAPAEKLSWLIALINACHERGIHVIMDGVFNHVGDMPPDAKDNAYGFPYHWLYRDPAASPYTGTFGNTFPGLQEIDFHNGCAQEFIRDVCFYWMDAFGIDGLRLDNTVNYFVEGDDRGLPRLLRDIQDHAIAKAETNFSLTLEHINISAASVVARTAATSYWHNGLYQAASGALPRRQIEPRLLRALDSHAFLPDDKVATTYLSNHDHTQLAWWAGQATESGGKEWYWAQPYILALLTAPGAPMIPNGQEFTEDYWLVEDEGGGNRRVYPRPLHWNFVGEKFGAAALSTFAKAIAIRHAHSALRSNNIYPGGWEDWQTRFNPEGYGIDTERQLLIYHRWGNADDGTLERFIIVLNFSHEDQFTDVPFSAEGLWRDLLSDETVNVTGFRLNNQRINSHWGKIYYRKG
jgi:glycosidase